MRLLLDTHVAIWAVQDDARLPTAIKQMIASPRNEVAVSAVSIWEIAIKSSLDRRGLGKMPVSASEALRLFIETDFDMLSLTAEHALAVEDLPALHGDPFDRLIVAQSLTEPMRLVTYDDTVAAYNSSIIHF